jgi:hypothetical protein
MSLHNLPVEDINMRNSNAIGRRDAIKLAAVGLAAVATGALAQQPSAAALEAAFRAAFATPADKPGDVATARLAFLHDAALAIDSDVPFPLDRAGYADHLGFHGQYWERMDVQLHEVRTAIHGSTGIVSAYYNQRGKPRNAGFRLRPGYCTAVCTLEGGRWRALALHMAPLSAQILDASPG